MSQRRIFISYSSKDRDFIIRLADELKLLGYEVWFDQELKWRGGHQWWAEIMEALRQSDVFLYAGSDNLVASEPCKHEYKYALDLGKPVLPVQIGPLNYQSLPTTVVSSQILDMRGMTHEQRVNLKASIDSLSDAPALPSNALDLEPLPPLDPIGVLIEGRVSAAPPLIIPSAPLKPAKPHYTADQQRLLHIMLDPERVPSDREKAGQDINKYGDPRSGVIDFNFKVGDYWCPLPAGTYPLGSDQQNDNPKHNAKLSAFCIAKYPITYAQFQAFIDTKFGYSNAAWWRGLHPQGLEQQKAGPGSQCFKFDNHPRENVSWYDAMAFCRWLSAKLGYEISLATEEQWEAAARGTDGRKYPWGTGYKVGFANIDETYSGAKVGSNYLRQTSAVGIYPQSESPYHVLDMSGNVWEWCLNLYKSGKINNSSNEGRTLRSGSWPYDSGSAHAPNRDSFDPASRYRDFGFRVVCVVCL